MLNSKRLLIPIILLQLAIYSNPGASNPRWIHDTGMDGCSNPTYISSNGTNMAADNNTIAITNQLRKGIVAQRRHRLHLKEKFIEEP